MENSLKKATIEMLCCLEGYHQLCKMLHWSATIKSKHELTDDIDSKLLDFQDELAEVCMGIIGGEKFGLGTLKTMLPSAKDVESMLKELEDDVLAYKKRVGNEGVTCAIHSIVDEFLSQIEKWKYFNLFN